VLYQGCDDLPDAQLDACYGAADRYATFSERADAISSGDTWGFEPSGYEPAGELPSDAEPADAEPRSAEAQSAATSAPRSAPPGSRAAGGFVVRAGSTRTSGLTALPGKNRDRWRRGRPPGLQGAQSP